jgi:3-hydroxyacyl-CoA dehydrogenase/enoyl-CoA hydratase/3-hydroxybutyryl-CoA epimerase
LQWWSNVADITSASPGESPYALHTDVHDGIATIVFDLPNEPVNKFNRRVKDEFAALFERLSRDSSVVGAVLLSGKEDVWIAGADIEEFLQLRSVAEAERMSREGQELLESLERLRFPVVAAIHGACMGGGLEAALACSWRIVTDHPKTILALPEVQLGLIPGAGGTQRLPRVVGTRAALDMILSGRSVRARKALQMGLAGEMVHPAILRDIAERRAREMAERGMNRWRGKRRRSLIDTVIDSTPPGRNIVFRKAREKTLEKSGGHYPAPLAALQAVEAGFRLGREEALRNEARLFGEMAVTDVARQLIYLFFAGNSLKRDAGVPDPAPDPVRVRKLAVLGAGFMGAGISAIAAQNGLLVRMKDAEHGRVARGFAAIRPVIEERHRKKHITRQQMEDELSRISGTIDYSGFKSVDLVVEAVFEDLEIKQQVLREVERELPEHAVFASNTSTIPIESIARASSRPDRVIGMHFFSPVHRMPLLEVIVTPRTDPQVVVTVVATGKRLGKTVIVVNDGPGFYVNRILSPYINEAGILLDQGARIEAIDEAMVRFGFPVGPITLIDEVGLDVAAKAGTIMADALGPRLTPARSLTAVAGAGRYGRKNGKGFYRYDSEGRKGNVDASVYSLMPTGETRVDIPAAEIQSRLLLAMLNEAARCFEDGILRSARDGDIGAVYGIGFPPFMGGPFRCMDTVGIADLAQQLEELNHRFPGRFEPADVLTHMARHGLNWAGGVTA